MNCCVVSVFTNLHCADCVHLDSTHLAGFFLGEIFRVVNGTYSSVPFPSHLYACPISSHLMGCFPWDSHRNDIPMDNPGNITYPVWTCGDPIFLILGTPFTLILGTRVSILGTQIGLLKRLNKILDLVIVTKL